MGSRSMRPASARSAAGGISKGRLCGELSLVQGELLGEDARRPDAASHPAEFTYTATWRPAPLTPTGDDAPAGPVLILYTPAGRPLADALAVRHIADGVVHVELGTVTRQSAPGRWELDATAPDAPAALRDTLPRPRTVYFLGGLRAAAEDGPAELDRAEESGVRALFRCAQQLVIPAAATRPTDWRIVTNDAWPVAGGRVVNPYAAALAGMARVLENEHRHWSVPVVDLGLAGHLPGPAGSRRHELAALVIAEPAERGARVAHRDGVRYRQALRPVTLPPADATVIRTGGTYAVVGGAGGIGLEMARFLARDHGARVALIGRSPLDEDRRRRIADADPDGSRLLYVRADASDEDGLRAGLARVHERFGPVHGVFHSALDHTAALVRHLDDSALRAGLAAKSGVSVALAAAFRAEPLDFLLFFSSAQSFLGDPGLAGYAAGSTFQDAYAHALDQRLPFPVRSIDWGYWGTVGAVSGEGHREWLTRQGFRSISPREGWDTVLRTLAGPETQVLALPAEDVLLKRLGLGGGQPAAYAQPSAPVAVPATARIR
ncbi:SDR family NAD(P)-dependent oxidoreductase [Streptomyces syringium]|uniref:NAD(P)-dependent dehydrogenase (Short-subunit alcohol dehydrogenase family) n=1 Tax=Streptomyces syringium TaxID=76729 RepID=A0ABS4Y439_9ACTN|nr:SDR family NAD(P)-dependent oxidoreductase [Streptomyces syringium]MBP2403546.1 NAD(P)-dependent dehydrogenase (short-subunit alcohol dehydrogenase family) [Streptomyces syringium]